MRDAIHLQKYRIESGGDLDSEEVVLTASSIAEVDRRKTAATLEEKGGLNGGSGQSAGLDTGRGRGRGKGRSRGSKRGRGAVRGEPRRLVEIRG